MPHILSTTDLNLNFVQKIIQRAGEITPHLDFNHLQGYNVTSLRREYQSYCSVALETAVVKLGGKCHTIFVPSFTDYTDIGHACALITDCLVTWGVPSHILKKWPKDNLVVGESDKEAPLQALTDLYTIQRELGRLKDFNLLLFGNPESAEALSITAMLKMFGENVQIRYLNRTYDDSECKSRMRSSGFELEPTAEARAKKREEFHKRLQWADVIYASRFPHHYGMRTTVEAKELAINESTLQQIKKNAIIMHALPRGDELGEKVDGDPRVVVWKQARNSVLVCMAFLEQFLLG